MKNIREYGKNGRILTIPNIMSFFRIALIPVCVWLYVYEKNYPGATLVLILSGLTDVADGYIARHFDMVSDLGKALDPVADKLTQWVMLICLLSRFPNMILLVVLQFVKELLMGITGLLAVHRTGEVHGAVWHGKLNTVLLYCLIFLHFIWYGIPMAVSNVMIGGCTVMMLVSCVLYVGNNIRLIQTEKAGEN